jgi:hypothetical protein
VTSISLQSCNLAGSKSRSSRTAPRSELLFAARNRRLPVRSSARFRYDEDVRYRAKRLPGGARRKLTNSALWKIRYVVGGREWARGRMRRLLKYALVLALAVGVGCYVVLGPLSLDDLVPLPADRNAAVIPVEHTPPTSPASIDEGLAAKHLASLAGSREFLEAHPSGAYAQSERAEVARLARTAPRWRRR